MEKEAIRKIMCQKREALSLEARALSAKEATTLLIKSKIFSQSNHIACYAAKGAEMDPDAIVEKAWALNKHCYLPVVHAARFGQMHFVEYLPQSELTTNRFGIREPLFQEEKVIEARKLDLVIVPLVAFDAKGHRIGTGGGYYDHAFKFLKEIPSLEKPFLCGLAYGFQQVPKIVPEKEDISLHAVVTESQMMYFSV